ncbi:MAG: phosphatase PAP2 family protein [Polyangiaceae bacterium]
MVAALIERFVRHFRTLWPGASFLMTAPFTAWFIWTVLINGERRFELFLIFGVVNVLALINAKTKRLFVGLYPIGLLGLVYDSMRFWKSVGITPERIHICDLRAIDMSIFSVDLGNGVRGSVHDYFLVHHTTFLDVICAIPYGTFIYVDIAFAIFLYTRDYQAMQRFGWTFLLLNIAGFTTYHIYPAAPPWYYHAHGCIADMSAHASEGPHLTHVDALMGWKYFAGFYGRSNDVFGAVPSLHVSYPLLVILYGWRYFKTPLRVAISIFFIVMCFAAVYLDHHWIFDVLLGILYTLAVHNGVRLLWNRISPPTKSTEPSASLATAVPHGA